MKKRRGLVSDVRLPDFIKNAPELWFWLHPYYEAFTELSTCRPVDGFTGTVGRIPWTAIDRYADRYEWAGRDFEVFVLYIGALDDKLLELVKSRKPKGPNKPRDPRSTRGGMQEPED